MSYCAITGAATAQEINRSICGDERDTIDAHARAALLFCRPILVAAFSTAAAAAAPPVRAPGHLSTHISHVKKYTWPRVYAYSQTNLATGNVSLAMLLHLYVGVYVYVCMRRAGLYDAECTGVDLNGHTVEQKRQHQKYKAAARENKLKTKNSHRRVLFCMRP